MKSDTSPEMRARYQAMIMELSPGERMIKCCQMFDMAKALVMAGLETEDNPDNLSLRARVFLRIYGSDYTPEERDRIVARLNEI